VHEFRWALLDYCRISMAYKSNSILVSNTMSTVSGLSFDFKANTREINRHSDSCNLRASTGSAGVLISNVTSKGVSSKGWGANKIHSYTQGPGYRNHSFSAKPITYIHFSIMQRNSRFGLCVSLNIITSVQILPIRQPPSG